jgi:hypothetical protein
VIGPTSCGVDPDAGVRGVSGEVGTRWVGLVSFDSVILGLRGMDLSVDEVDRCRQSGRRTFELSENAPQ